MCFQLLARYGARAENLKALHAEVTMLRNLFQKFQVKHVERELNREADALATAALERERRYNEERGLEDLALANEEIAPANKEMEQCLAVVRWEQEERCAAVEIEDPLPFF